MNTESNKATRSPKNQKKINKRIKESKKTNKATQARHFWEDKTYLSRIKTLEQYGEYGYAFLNLWNRIETGAKLCYYMTKKEIPVSLHNNWQIWKKLKAEKKELFENVLSTSQDKESLQNSRNAIVHQTKTLDKETYEKYCTQAQEFLKYIENMLNEEFKAQLDQLKNAVSK